MASEGTRAVALNGRHHAAIKGLPEIPCYVWVQGKAPKYDNWNDPARLMTPEQLFAVTPPAGFEPDGFGLASGRWSGTMAVDFDEHPDRPGGSERVFQATTGYSSDALPPSATVVSGRPGRRRVILSVPPVWNVPLAGYSSSLMDLEFRWEAEGPAPIQSVICGNHPDNPEWHFRWQEGLSPAEVGIAEAPVWLLATMVRLRGEKKGKAAAAAEGTGGGGREPGEPGPCDQLEPRLQRKLIVTVLSPKWPYRGGAVGSRFAASWKTDFSALLGALNTVLGPEMAEEWLKDTPWYRNNADWGPFPSLKAAIHSVGRSDTDRVAGWGTLVALATRKGKTPEGGAWTAFPEEGAKLPPWALPPRDPLESVDDLTRIIQKMNQSEGKPIQMALLEGEAQRLGVKPSRLYQLRLEELLGVAEDRRGRSLSEIAEAKSQRSDDRQRDVVDGLLKRRVTCLAGASNSGKTTMAAYLVRNVVLGGQMSVGFTSHDVPVGRVLWFTSDCSDEAVHDELLIQGVNPAEVGDRLRVVERATFNNMLQVVSELQEFKPDLVVMDCLSSMAVNHVSVADPAFSQPLRDLQTYNGKAWPRAAFLMLHHTTRDQPVRFSGGEQIKAAVEEMWIYYDPQLVERKKPGEKMKPVEETGIRKLWFEKSRSGYRGKELSIVYEAAKNRWLWRPSGAASKDPRALVDAFFRTWRGDEWKLPAEWRRELLEKGVQLEKKPVERMLKLLEGSLLESEVRFHARTGKELTHYRALPHVRRLAAETWEGTKNGEGVNLLE